MANPSSSPPGPPGPASPPPDVAGDRSIRNRLQFAARSVDITPPVGSRLAGYLARGDAPADGVLEPLEATIFRVRDPRAGGESVTWVAMDALAVDVDLARSIADAVGAASGVPAETVVVCASHTHSGPSGWLTGIPLAAPEVGDPGMRAELVRRIAEAAAGLAGRETPVRAALGVGEAHGVGTNRTDPGTPSDRSIGALSMIDADGAIVGVLLDHASHPTVLGHDNRLWSADWPGSARRTVAAALRGRTPSDRPPVIAFLQGAAGDVSPRFVRRSQSPAEVERIGGLFGAQALAAILATDEPVDAEPDVAIRRRQVTVPTRRLPARAILTARVATAEQEWRRAASQAGTGTPAERIARTRHEGASTAERFAEAGLPPSLELPLSVVVLGRDAWLHLPVEPFSSLAAEISARSPFRHTRVIGYADGYVGYAADDEAYGLEIYEAASSPFDPAGVRILVDASIALLTHTHDELRRRDDHA